MNVSPDGRQLATFKQEGDDDIWITDLDRGTSTRFTFDEAVDDAPVWSPDGSRIAFVSNRDGGVFNIYVKSSGGTGSEELLLRTPRDKIINDWSRDGRTIVYEEVDPQTGSDLWMLPLDGDRKAQRLLSSPFDETEGALSPDGRWLAYVSNEEGIRQVYLQRFPETNRRWRVSTTRTLNAAHPRWGPKGTELFLDQNGSLSVVSVEASGPDDVRLGEQEHLFVGMTDRPHNFAVVADGSKFLVLGQTGAPSLTLAGARPLTVIVNWAAGLAIPR
jgi:Tol biopolymer transport system component